MIIPPVVGAPPSANGSEVTGDGFAEAIAAALGVPVEPVVALPTPTETTVDVAVPAPAPYTEMPDQIARLVAAAIASDTPDAPAASQNRPSGAGPAVEDMITGGAQRASIDVTLRRTATAEPDSIERAGEDDGVAVEGPAPEAEAAAPPQPDLVRGAGADQPVQAAAHASSTVPTTAAPPVSIPTDPTASPGVEDAPPPVTRATEHQPQATPVAHTQNTEIAQSAEIAEDGATAAEPAPAPAPAGDREVETRSTVDVKPVIDPGPDGATTIERPHVAHTTPRGQTELVPVNTLRRVENAIRHLENAPPPKTITIAVDDQGLHRVTVSLQADGVRLSVPEGSTTDSRLIADLEQSLASRGFDLSGREQQHQRDRRDETDTFIPASPWQPRSETRSGSRASIADGSDLRI